MKQITYRVLTVGGGSAGHVAPVVAVIDELASRHPSIEVRFWCDRSFFSQSKSLMGHAAAKVRVEKIFAGKLRRYYGKVHFSDLPAFCRNILDFFAIAAGFLQSIAKLLLWRPHVVFCKGGFVCLPVGVAAALLRIPLVIHDSDARPGLTNRLLAPFASLIATGAPLKYYNYPAQKARYVGIPVGTEYRHYSAREKQQTKQSFQLPPDAPLLVVMGGSLGAKTINDAMVAIGARFTGHFSVVHISGTRQYEALKDKVPQADNYKLAAFLSDRLGRLFGAADIVISRAGASALSELAATGPSVIMIPGSQLADQQKNAAVFSDAKAAVLCDEKELKHNPTVLYDEVMQLFSDHVRRHSLSLALASLVPPHAAGKTVDLIEEAATWQ